MRLRINTYLSEFLTGLLLLSAYLPAQSIAAYLCAPAAILSKSKYAKSSPGYLLEVPADPIVAGAGSIKTQNDCTYTYDKPGNIDAMTYVACGDTTNPKYDATADGDCCTSAAFDSAYHRCGVAGGTGITSAVSGRIGGVCDAQFNNAVNKRYDCCVNFNIGLLQTYFPSQQNPMAKNGQDKFDCVANPQKQTSFNALWSSMTDGLPNAVLLPTTGFYDVNGKRCDEYGEVSQTPIQPFRVSKIVTKGITTATVGTGNPAAGTVNVDPRPAGSSTSYPTIPVPAWPNDSYLAHLAPAGPLRSPPNCNTKSMDCYRCRYLVRAAFQAECPAMSNVNTVAPRKTFKDASGVDHCSVADTIHLHLRIEELYHVEGTKPFKTIDTVMDNGLVSPIDVRKLIMGQ